ncbi:MAG: TatD family hydrolase [Christensenellales bacterium]
MIIDTHAHIVDEKITKSPDEVLETFFKKGGDKYFAISTSMKDIETVFNTCKKYQNAYAVIGIHPHYADEMNEANFEKLETLIKDATAVGEIGLDYYYDFSDREKQKEVFIKQLDLAKKYDKPLSIHTRDATEDTLNILKSYSGLSGIIHCFSGSIESAKEYINLGFYLGIGGVITFKNSTKLKEVVKSVGLEHIVLETDSPYLTPEPFRGQENEAYNVTLVAKKVAEILNVSENEVYKKTTQNVFKIFNLKN